jgi:hypothetical protein
MDSGEQLLVPLQGDLPPGYTTGRDTLQVIATRGTASFRWLELGPLDSPRRDPGGAPGNALEELLAALTIPTRDTIPRSTASKHWNTASLELEVVA